MPDFLMRAERLRGAFQEMSAEIDLGALSVPEGAMASAVLIPLHIHQSGQASILLTRRSDRLRHHAGQISFPGGRMEQGDVSAEHTALRETREEIGIPECDVAILGRLPVFSVPSGFAIHPILGLVRGPLRLRLDPDEVADAFEVPLEHLVRDQNYQKHRILRPGGVLHTYAIAYRGRFIWGATAGMLVQARPYLETVLRSAKI